MTDLEIVRAEPVPRSPALARRYARRFDSIGGFLVYGCLWFCLAVALGVTVLVTLGQYADRHPGTPLAPAVPWLALLAFIVPWPLFARWVGRRLARAARLFRDGTFYDATIVDLRFVRINGGPMTDASLSFQMPDGLRRVTVALGGEHKDLAVGAVTPVLYVADYGYCAAFLDRGAMKPGAVDVHVAALPRP